MMEDLLKLRDEIDKLKAEIEKLKGDKEELVKSKKTLIASAVEIKKTTKKTEEVEIEMAHLERRQRELNETIASIENDLRN